MNGFWKVLGTLFFGLGVIVYTGFILIGPPEARPALIVIDLLFAFVLFLLLRRRKPEKMRWNKKMFVAAQAPGGNISAASQNRIPALVGSCDGLIPSAANLTEYEVEHTDTDEGVPTPSGAVLSYLDAQALKFWNGKRTDFVIPSYYAQSAFGRNVGPALDRLLENGYLALGDIHENISLKTMPELKSVLSEHRLKVSGKKADLVQRILEHLPPDEVHALFPVGVYKITEKGVTALEPYSILALNTDYNLGLSKYRLLQARENFPDISDEDLIVRMLSEDIQKCYQCGSPTTCQEILTKTAVFMSGNGEDQKAFECYCLSFFIWTRQIEEYSLPVSEYQQFYLAKGIEESGLKCNYTLPRVIERFSFVVSKCNPFGMATSRNIKFAISILQNTFSIEV